MKWEDEQETVAVFIRMKAVFAAASDLFVACAEHSRDEEMDYWEVMSYLMLDLAKNVDRMKDIFRKKKKDFEMVRLPPRLELEEVASGIEGKTELILLESVKQDKFSRLAFNISTWMEGLKIDGLLKTKNEEFNRLGKETADIIKKNVRELAEKLEE